MMKYCPIEIWEEVDWRNPTWDFQASSIFLNAQNLQWQLQRRRQLAKPLGSQYAGTALGRHEIHIVSLIWDMSFETY